MIRERRGHTLGDAIREIERTENLLTATMVAALDTTMRGIDLDIRSKVHVEHGALLASTRSGTDVRDDGKTWLGWVAMGGPGTEQAVYEVALGGEHDPFRDAAAYDDALEATIEAEIRRHLG